MYVSSPVKALVGAFQVDDVHEGKTSQLWQLLGEKAGISKEQFDAYYEGVSHGVGIGVGPVKKLDNPVALDELREMFGDFTAPQSYRYLSHHHLERFGLKQVVKAA